MDNSQIGATVVAATSLLGVLLTYFKFKPGQRQQVELDTAEGTLNLAEGTVQLVTSTLEAQFRRMAERMEEIERDAARYRQDTEKRHAELMAELRAERAMVKHLEGEVERRDAAITERDGRIDGLMKRVKRLENEVATLTGKRGPHSPT